MTSTSLHPASSAIPLKDPLFTYDQAAEYMNVSPRMTRRLTVERRIEFVKVGKHVRIPLSAIETYLRENTVPTLREEHSVQSRHD